MRPRIRIACLAACLVALPVAPAAAADPIVVCIHSPLTGASPTPPPDAARAYFRHLNEHEGGVDGREVQVSYYDDQYYPAGARAAAEKCLQTGAHLLVGASSNDVHHSVASWAAWRGMPYLAPHGSELLVSSENATTAQLDASNEEQYRALADGIVGNRAALTDGAELRVAYLGSRSPYEAPGREAFAETLAAHGYELAYDTSVPADAGNFTEHWVEMQRRGVNVIAFAGNTLMFARMMRSRPPLYRPSFTAIGSQLANSFARRMAGDLPLMTFSAHPTYDPNDPALPWADEIERMSEILSAGGFEGTPDDFDWVWYLRAKQLHRLLDALDGDTSSAAILHAFTSYTEDDEDAWPSCPVTFDEERVGADAWNTWLSRPAGWEQHATCSRAPVNVSFAPEPPTLDCGSHLQIGGIVRCRATEQGDLLYSLRVDIDSASTAASELVVAETCSEELVLSHEPLPPDAYVVTARATTCAGWQAEAHVAVVGTGS